MVSSGMHQGTKAECHERRWRPAWPTVHGAGVSRLRRDLTALRMVCARLRGNAHAIITTALGESVEPKEKKRDDRQGSISRSNALLLHRIQKGNKVRMLRKHTEKGLVKPSTGHRVVPQEETPWAKKR
jgi:hypothetical protein